MVDALRRLGLNVLHKPVLAAGLLYFSILNIFFAPFLWGDKSLLSSSGEVGSVFNIGALGGRGPGPQWKLLDPVGSGALAEPNFELEHHQLFAEHDLPLWNPDIGLGVPEAAAMQQQSFNPVAVLFMVIHPSERGYAWYIVFRLFVAGFFAFLFFRMFMKVAPAFAGGVAFMLSGYFMLFVSMPHVSVEVLISPLFFCNEALLRRTSWRTICATAITTFLILVGGMPESALLALSLGYLYAIYRTVSDGKLRSFWRQRLFSFAAAALLGFALAAILLLPFVEYVSHAFDSHQPQYLHGQPRAITDVDGPASRLLGTYIAPLMYGPLWENILYGFAGPSGLRGYCGASAAFLALLATVNLARSRRNMADPAWFFLGTVVFLLLKRFGSPVANWIGYLPGFRYVVFNKYEEPLLAFAVSALAAFGFASILDGKFSKRRFLTTSVFALSVFTVLISMTNSYVRVLAAHTEWYYGSLLGALAALGLTWTICYAIVLSRSAPRTLRWLAVSCSFGIVAELGFNYYVPMWYFVDPPAPSSANPYAGAPYISFLQRSTASTHDRVWSQDGFLESNWAEAFGLQDSHDNDAMYPAKFLPFARNLIPDAGGDIVYGFVGPGPYSVASSGAQRFLTLSSSRYILTPSDIDPTSIELLIQQQNADKLSPDETRLVAFGKYEVGGAVKDGVFEHPPTSQLPAHVHIPREHPRLSINVGMPTEVWNKPGRGVRFTLEVRDSTGQVSTLFSRYVDPKHRPSDRRWILQRLDLARFAGQDVDLLFSTSPGPSGDTRYAWAVWGQPTLWEGAHAATNPFRLIYNADAKIYEFTKALPRAALFNNIEIAANDQLALRALASHMNISQTALVNESSIVSNERASFLKLTESKPKDAVAAQILSYKSSMVTILTKASSLKLLVLNDTFYPGWNAYVDATKVPIVTANYTFRGVIVPAGRHVVRFSYEPLSFRLGSTISATALLAMVTISVIAFQRRKSASPVGYRSRFV